MILHHNNAVYKSWLKYITLFLLFAAISMPAWCQPAVKPQKVLIQLSGIVSGEDTRTPLPFSTIHIKSSFRGTISGVDGFYSLVVGEKDTVIYQAFGHKTQTFVVPVNVQQQMLTHSVVLAADTFEIVDKGMYPYASKEEFKQAFMAIKSNDTYADIAKKNLDQEKLAELYESMARDGQENQIITLQQIANSYYYAGGQKNYMMMGNGSGVAVPTSLLNPFAWAEFIKDLKAGKFKKKKEKKSTDY